MKGAPSSAMVGGHCRGNLGYLVVFFCDLYTSTNLFQSLIRKSKQFYWGIIANTVKRFCLLTTVVSCGSSQLQEV